MSGYSQMPLLLLLRARCQEEAEEAQTSFLPDGVGSSLTLDLDLDLGKGQGKGVHEQVQGAGLAKRGRLFRNCIYMKQPNMKIFTYRCRARSGRRRRRRRCAWRCGWKSLVFNVSSSAIYV